MENTSGTVNFGSNDYSLNTTSGSMYPAMDIGSIVRMICYILFSLTIVASNAFIIATYWSVKEIRKDIANTFIVNISYADLMVGLINIPFLGVTDFFQRWIFGEIFCKIRVAWAYVNTFVPVLVVVLLAAFHRLRMSRNHTYRNAVKQVHVTIIMAACWFLEACFDLSVAFGFPIITKKSVLNYDFHCDMEFPYTSLSFTVFFVVLKFLIPLVIYIVLCVNLFLSIRRVSNRINDSGRAVADTTRTMETSGRKFLKSNDVNMPENGEQSINSISGEFDQKCNHLKTIKAPSTSPHNPVVNNFLVVFDVSCQGSSNASGLHPGQTSRSEQPTSSNQFQVPRHRKNTGSTRAQKHRLYGHRRSAVMLFVLVSAFLVFWTPIVIIFIIMVVCPTCITGKSLYWAYLIVYCNSLVNPFLYAATNRRFQRGFIKVLRLRRWRRFRNGFCTS